MKIVLGTSGYHFPDWSGTFYPERLDKSQWLPYYATHFQAVEINSTYYGLPRLSTVERWAEQTPGDFSFFIKLNSETTHKREGTGEETRLLLEVLSPLSRSGKLRGLLAQFPATFHAGPEEEKYLAKIAANRDGIPLFVEFRHSSWDHENSVELCRRLDLGWVIVDQPPLPTLVRPRPAVTGRIAYVRFHGRNSMTWYNRDQGDRYDWNYSDSELLSWKPRLAALNHRAETSYLFFNNCHAGQAVKNALRMRELLQDQLEAEVI